MAKRIFILLCIILSVGWMIGQTTSGGWVLPSPEGVLSTMVKRWDRLLYHTWITYREMAIAFFFAALIAFPLAGSMAYFRHVRMVIQPFFLITQSVPMFTLAPLMVFWFGWSLTAIVVPTALMILFPLTINLYRGLTATPQAYLDLFQVYRATSWQTFLKLRLPWSLSHIMAGVRISTAIAGIGAVGGEWAGAQEGLGMLMLESRRAVDLEMTFAALICLILLSSSLYVSALIVERILLRSFRLSYQLVGIFCFCALVLSGCSQENSKNQTTTLVLDWLPNPNHVPLYYGLAQGIFEKQGIDLRILKIHDPGDGLGYLTTGRADVALYYGTYYLRAVERGVPLQPVGILVDEPLNALIYRKSAAIREISDLQGCAIGYCIDGTHDATLETILASKDVKSGEIHNVSFDLVSSLATEQVAAIFNAYWNIEVPQLAHLGVDCGWFPVQDFGMPAYPELLFVAQEGGAAGEPDFIARFQEALQQSIVACRENPQEAFDVYAKNNPDKGEKTLQWEWHAWRLTLPVLADHQDIGAERFLPIREWLIRHGLL